MVHVLFTRIFFISKSYSFVFNPNLHALLHIPETLRERGPLYNVSQFLIERIVGELEPMLKSRYRPNSNVLNKTHRLFTLRLLNGGLAKAELKRKGNGDRAWIAVGTGDDSTEREEIESAMKLSYEIYSEARNITMLSLRKVQAVKRVTPRMIVETVTRFESRRNTATYVRQAFFVAAEFVADGQNLRKESYGTVIEIWECQVQCEFGSGTSKMVSFMAAKIKWENGIRVCNTSNVPYISLKKGKKRNRAISVSIETMECVRRFLLSLTLGRAETDTRPMRTSDKPR